MSDQEQNGNPSESLIPNVIPHQTSTSGIFIRSANEETVCLDQLKINSLAADLHDINNCLTTVIGESEIALMYDAEKLSDSSLESLSAIKTTAILAAAIARKAMAVLSSSRHPLILNIESINLEDLLTEIAGAHQKKCTINNACTLTTFDADRHHLVRVLTNLIGNALKYSTDPTIPVRIDLSNDDKNLIIKIIDHGQGLGDHPEQLFEYYQRGENVTKIPGFGIGLGYCKLICETHGGSISAQNNENEAGSTFIVKLPLKRS
jgi:signal transduction histidine kinase